MNRLQVTIIAIDALVLLALVCIAYPPSEIRDLIVTAFQRARLRWQARREARSFVEEMRPFNERRREELTFTSADLASAKREGERLSAFAKEHARKQLDSAARDMALRALTEEQRAELFMREREAARLQTERDATEEPLVFQSPAPSDAWDVITEVRSR